METVFTWIADGFNMSTTAGFGAIGVTLSGLFVVLYALYWLGVVLWCFVEDSEASAVVFKYLLETVDDETKRISSIPIGEDEDWYEGRSGWCGSKYYPKGSEIYILGDVCGTFPVAMTIGLAACFAVLGAIIQGIMFIPVISSCIISVFLAVFGARGIRRLQKKLNTHLEDANAHTEEKKDV